MWKNIIISGGNTLFPGYAERLRAEILRLSASNSLVNVIAMKERGYATWIGGSVISNLSSYQAVWIDRDLYQEAGAQVIHRR